MRLAAFFAALLACGAADDSVPPAALEADSECQAGGEVCSLSALQRRALSSGAEAKDSEKEQEFSAAQATAWTGDGQQRRQKHGHSDGRRPDQERKEDGRPRGKDDWRRRPGEDTARCCLCQDGSSTWSGNGNCHRCRDGGGIQRVIAPTPRCRSREARNIPGRRVCTRKCRRKFRRGGGGGGGSPSPSPGWPGWPGGGGGSSPSPPPGWPGWLVGGSSPSPSRPNQSASPTV
mmetsp:Transcript_36985/g.110449  ORF Transcript_36985/g.110449 Transcript_36985/m.110449 type:complete len:233 (+) Transcript_36985:55-753(+)